MDHLCHFYHCQLLMWIEWGSSDCIECGQFCYGHYLKPENMSHNQSYIATLPPSMEIQQFFIQLKDQQPTEDELTAVAKKVLLPISEVQMWLDHLHEVHKNRQRGATKAAETREAKQVAKEQASESVQLLPATNGTTIGSGEENVCCGVCGDLLKK